MAKTGCDLHVMRRLLHSHQWTNVADWACAISDLADLSDEEIERVADPSSRRALVPAGS